MKTLFLSTAFAAVTFLASCQKEKQQPTQPASPAGTTTALARTSAPFAGYGASVYAKGIRPQCRGSQNHFCQWLYWYYIWNDMAIPTDQAMVTFSAGPEQSLPITRMTLTYQNQLYPFSTLVFDADEPVPANVLYNTGYSSVTILQGTYNVLFDAAHPNGYVEVRVHAQI